MPFELRAERRQRRLLDVRYEQDGVRVADRNGRARNGFPVDRQRLLRAGDCIAHIDGNALDLPAGHEQFQRPHAGQRLDRQAGFVRIAFVVHVFADAADAVSAHLRFAAVRIEDPHFEIRDVGRRDPDHSVRPGAEVPVGEPYRKRLRLDRFAIYVQVVVAESLHFCKVHIHRLPFFVSGHCPFVRRTPPFRVQRYPADFSAPRRLSRYRW